MRETRRQLLIRGLNRGRIRETRRQRVMYGPIEAIESLNSTGRTN